MITCPNCGAELEENANFCSLCGEPLPVKNEDNPAYLELRRLRKEEKLVSDYRKLTGLQRRKIIWQISVIILGAGMIIVALIDVAVNHNITWSKFPLTGSVVLFINISLVLFLYRRRVLLLLLSFLSTSGFLVLLDIFAGRTGWGMKLGIPLLLAAYVSILLLILLIKRARQKGLNVIAYVLLTSGVMCLCTDGIISIYKKGDLSFNWSLIVVVSMVIISTILFYIHYRLKKVTDLKRFFHI